MTNRDTILKELNELDSSLAGHKPQNIYSVPAGYFDGLADQILKHIKASENSNAKKEVELLSPMLSFISREMPYAVPAGYFENLSQKILLSIRESADYQTSEEEIESLSPMLSSLKKKNPYSVPAGYFENLDTNKGEQVTKVISITSRKWYRIAVAAVVIGIIAIGGLLFINPNPVDPNKNPDKWISKNISKKVSTDKIDEFVKLTEEEENLKVSAENNAPGTVELKELMKDVPEKEIQDFLNDAVALGSNDGTSVLMN